MSQSIKYLHHIYIVTNMYKRKTFITQKSCKVQIEYLNIKYVLCDTKMKD